MLLSSFNLPGRLYITTNDLLGQFNGKDDPLFGASSISFWRGTVTGVGPVVVIVNDCKAKMAANEFVTMPPTRGSMFVVSRITCISPNVHLALSRKGDTFVMDADAVLRLDVPTRTQAVICGRLQGTTLSTSLYERAENKRVPWSVGATVGCVYKSIQSLTSHAN